MPRRAPFLSLLFTAILSLGSSAAQAAEPSAIESDLVITVQGEERHVSLDEALKLLNIPSASIALIDEGRIAFARAYGKDATPDTLYQAASLSKFVAAIGAMRLVEDGTLAARSGRERQAHLVAACRATHSTRPTRSPCAGCSA